MSYDEFLPFYQGRIQSVSVVTTQGIRIQFPAMHLKVFLMSSGISGYFCMMTENNKFLSLQKIK